MTDSILENNLFYKYLRESHGDQLCHWCEPDWVVCIPQNDIAVPTPAAAVGHALKKYKSRAVYTSELYGENVYYQITDSDPRGILSYTDETEHEAKVPKVNILDEYLITVKEKIVHLLLIDGILDTTEEDDQRFLNKINTSFITSSSQSESFLRGFRGHLPLLQKIDVSVAQLVESTLPSGDVNDIQSVLHDLILNAWDAIIKTHTARLQTEPMFQDLLFRALDFYIVGRCHGVLWWQVSERCNLVDKMVNSRVSRLRIAQLSPPQLGVSLNYYTPLPAAVVELASIGTLESSIGRLHCISATLDLIKAQSKESRVTLHQYNDQEGDPELVLSEDELMGLLTMVLIEAQCSSLVSNIYYMTHFVFSVTEEQHYLWQGLGMLRRSLEHIMKLDVDKLPRILSPVRKELSLQDLMQVSADVESRFERYYESQSSSDITALDLQYHNLTQKIQLSTQAHSESQLSEHNSPGKTTDKLNNSAIQNQSKVHSFVEFLSSIPSSIRASFRRKQSQQKQSIQSSYLSQSSFMMSSPSGSKRNTQIMK